MARSFFLLSSPFDFSNHNILRSNGMGIEFVYVGIRLSLLPTTTHITGTVRRKITSIFTPQSFGFDGDVDDPIVSSSSSELSEEDEMAAAVAEKIWVRVKVLLKVYHVPKVPDFDRTGMEGVLKQHVAVWKGKRVSANLPSKVEFFKDIEGHNVKFFVHLKDDEFEYLD